MQNHRLGLTGFISLFLFLAASPSRETIAQTGSDGDSVAADHYPAYGSFSLLGVYGAFDGFRMGIGARLGYTMESGMYVGALFVDHFGTDNGTTYAWPFWSSTKPAKYYYGAVEIGYEERLAYLVAIKPFCGLGAFAGDESRGNQSDYFIAPGMLLRFWPGGIITLDVGVHLPVPITGDQISVHASETIEVFVSLGIIF